MESRVTSCSDAAVSSDCRHLQIGRVARDRAAVAAVVVEVEDDARERHRAQLGRDVAPGHPVDVGFDEDQVTGVNRLDGRHDAVVGDRRAGRQGDLAVGQVAGWALPV